MKAQAFKTFDFRQRQRQRPVHERGIPRRCVLLRRPRRRSCRRSDVRSATGRAPANRSRSIPVCPPPDRTASVGLSASPPRSASAPSVVRMWWCRARSRAAGAAGSGKERISRTSAHRRSAGTRRCRRRPGTGRCRLLRGCGRSTARRKARSGSGVAGRCARRRAPPERRRAGFCLRPPPGPPSGPGSCPGPRTLKSMASSSAEKGREGSISNGRTIRIFLGLGNGICALRQEKSTAGMDTAQSASFRSMFAVIASSAARRPPAVLALRGDRHGHEGGDAALPQAAFDQHRADAVGLYVQSENFSAHCS